VALTRGERDYKTKTHEVIRICLLILLINPLICFSQEDRQNADIVSVKGTGTPQNYTFHVEVSSPDKGCNQYANWWEVLSPNGELLYRRILGHSHVNEQPFIRSGGEVKINKDEIVIIRAHMNNFGYGGIAFKGSVENGFVQVSIDKKFALTVENQSPLPSGCAF
jgi:hypothetical protein